MSSHSPIFTPSPKGASGSIVSWGNSARVDTVVGKDDSSQGDTKSRMQLFRGISPCGVRPSVREKVPWGTALSSNRSMGEFEIALSVIVKLLILRQDLIGGPKRGEVDGAIFG